MKHIISGGNLFFCSIKFRQKNEIGRAVGELSSVGTRYIIFNADYYIAYKLYANTHVVPLFSNKDMPRFE